MATRDDLVARVELSTRELRKDYGEFSVGWITDQLTDDEFYGWSGMDRRDFESEYEDVVYRAIAIYQRENPRAGFRLRWLGSA